MIERAQTGAQPPKRALPLRRFGVGRGQTVRASVQFVAKAVAFPAWPSQVRETPPSGVTPMLALAESAPQTEPIMRRGLNRSAA
jgi:hypothetical protein